MFIVVFIWSDEKVKVYSEYCATLRVPDELLPVRNEICSFLRSLAEPKAEALVGTDGRLVNVHRRLHTRERVAVVPQKVVVISIIARAWRRLGNQGTATAQHSVNTVCSKSIRPSPDILDGSRIASVHIARTFEATVHTNVVGSIEEVANRSAVKHTLDPMYTERSWKVPIQNGSGIDFVNTAEIAVTGAANTNVLGAFEEIGDGPTPQGCTDTVYTKARVPSPLGRLGVES